MSESIYIKGSDERGTDVIITRFCGGGGCDDKLRYSLMVHPIGSSSPPGDDPPEFVFDRKQWHLLKLYVDTSIARYDERHSDGPTVQDNEQF
ncbi:MAG: hypothetical protein GY759_09015 [Chloroflexi bacterium]|nr:hypothetical protein [Chloroflexota bacterium]